MFTLAFLTCLFAWYCTSDYPLMDTSSYRGNVEHYDMRKVFLQEPEQPLWKRRIHQLCNVTILAWCLYGLHLHISTKDYLSPEQNTNLQNQLEQSKETITKMGENTYSLKSNYNNMITTLQERISDQERTIETLQKELLEVKK
jgi:uncharacterized protein HemX